MFCKNNNDDFDFEVIVLFIFAVVGKELFNESYKIHYNIKNMPRWNFSTVFHSFMIVFRVLCGEWIESMWDCMNTKHMMCAPFFLCTKIIGGFVVNFDLITTEINS